MSARFLAKSGVINHEKCSTFAKIEKAPENAIFKTKTAYKADPDPRKVNLGIGAYRTDEGVPRVLNVVRKAEKELAQDQKLDKEYFPIGGSKEFIAISQRLVLGADSRALAEKRVAGVQGLSGTGSLRVLFEFIKKHVPADVYISNPTWGNHKTIVTEAGLSYKTYSYWDPKTRGLDIDGMLDDLSKAPRGSIVLLHSCAHNPTGVDPTPQQWLQILDVVRNGGLVPFFDTAYQGFATGSLANDSASIRLFVDAGLSLFIAQSFAKNLGLYNERIGCASVVCSTAEAAVAVNSQLALVVRPMYSNPPSHGARLVIKILGNPVTFREWERELQEMSLRIQKMRACLVEELVKLKTPSKSGDWNHIVTQIGMFAFTGLTKEQVARMISKHHVYMLSNGRISMAGINSKNVAYVAQAIDEVVRNA